MTAVAMPKKIQTELGTEKLCIECKDYYPLDDEFFWFQWSNRNGKKEKQYSATCKACYDVRYRRRKHKQGGAA